VDSEMPDFFDATDNQYLNEIVGLLKM
jgi:putative methionine-R-sulfoxide reductase with GAF domain